MKGTSTLRLGVAALVALYPVAFVLRNPVPALAATMALLALLHARWRFRHALADVEPRVMRVLEPQAVRQGETAKVILTAEDARVPGAALRIDDNPPTTLRLPPATHGTGHQFAYTVRADLRGRHTWGSPRLTWRDETGFWVHAATLPAESALDVEPSPDSTSPGRRGATQVLHSERNDPLGVLREELEIHGVRPFQPGDRGRDVDWKRLSRGLGVLAKDWERQARPHLWILLDASWTMRSRLGGPSKLDHATALAQQLMRTAQLQAVQPGHALFDAHEVLDTCVPGAHDPALRLRNAAAAIPAARPARRRIAVGAMSSAAHDFGSALQVLRGRRPHAGIQAALRSTAPESRPVIFVLTDAHGASKDLVDGLRAARSVGARCIVGLLPDDDYFAAPKPPQPHDLVAAAREQRRIAHVLGILGQGGVRAVRITPADTAALLVAQGGVS